MGNNDQLTAAQIGELSTIRNILMGQQMNQYEAQFNQIGQDMATLRADFNRDLSAHSEQNDQHFQRLEHETGERFQRLEHEMNERFQRLDKDMNERFDRLEKLLADHVSRLDKKTQDTSRTDKNKIGKLLADISKKLIEEG